MSYDALKIICTGCDFEANELFEPIAVIYRHDSGEEVKWSKTAGWCYRCDTYSYIENIDPHTLRSDLLAMEQQSEEALTYLADLSNGFLAQLRHKSKRTIAMYELERLQSAKKVQRAILDIAINRRARPRCLRCESEYTAKPSFSPPDYISHDFIHKCGGMLKRVERSDGLRVNFGRETRYNVLNIEGELLEERVEKRPLGSNLFQNDVLS